MYRAPSGALVFGAGTVQWAWGLDNNHSGGSGRTSDDAVRQATVNLFADMGVQPATLQSGLSAATASTDTTAPDVDHLAPAAGATVPVGQPLTISGTATDAGGGKVGGVEVSTDNGISWHPATGRSSWSYTFTPAADGHLDDPDAGHRRQPPDGDAFGWPDHHGRQRDPPPPGSCPCTIWPSTATPAVASDPDTSRDRGWGQVPGRPGGVHHRHPVLQGIGNTGTHVGSLWSIGGTKLGSATFTGESASGWQQVNFATPVAVSANTTYVASYYAPNGRYSTTEGYFTYADHQRAAHRPARRGRWSQRCLQVRRHRLPNRRVRLVELLGRRRLYATEHDRHHQADRDRQAARRRRHRGRHLDATVTATFSEPVTSTSSR